MSLTFFSPAPRRADEDERQTALERSGVLARGPNGALQRLVAAASARFHVPIAAVTLIDRERQWFTARVGLEIGSTSRAVSFCAHAILRPGEPMVVEDATVDERFAGNPLVRSSPNIRFYAGIPLVDHGGYPLGALCLIDTEARSESIDMVEFGMIARQAERILVR